VATRDPWFRLSRRSGRPGLLTLARLLAFEVVVVAALYVLSPRPWLMILVAVVAVLFTALLFGRSRGRWWTESALLWLRYRRRGGAAGVRGDDPRLTALCELVPELVVEDLPGPENTKLGMGGDGAGWFAVLEVSLDASGALPPVPLAALARVAADAEQAGVVVQLVSHNAAGPRGRERAVWVGVRLDAKAVAESTLTRNQQVDVPAVLTEMVRRVERVLRRRGRTARVLTADELLAALARSCDLLPVSTATPAREAWQAWYSGRLAHRCYWVASWPDAQRGTALLARLADLPTTLVSIAFVLEPAFNGTSMTCVIRIAGVPGLLGPVCDQAEEMVRRAGGRLSGLDGQQAPGVYASAPSGGGAR
jgi:type VII secretion protein EccE